MAPIPPPPQILTVVDVVTFPDGVSTPVLPKADAVPVQSTPINPNLPLPVPTPETNPTLGPKPTDKRMTGIPFEPTQATPPVSPTPEPVPVPVPAPIPVPPAARQLLRPAVALPPPPSVTPKIAEPVSTNPAPLSPSLVQPDAQPLSISGAKLTLKPAAVLKPERRADLPTPPVAPPTPVPQAASVSVARPNTAVTTPQLSPAVPSVAAPIRTPSPPPPAIAAPKTTPLTISRAQTPLPKVQVPRIAATDLRLPEVPAAEQTAGAPIRAAPSGAPSGAGATGVTSVTAAVGSSSGAPSSSQSGVASGAGARTGPSAGGPAGAASAPGAGAAGGISAGSPTGILPRRPGGAAVREAFPRGDSSTILGRMDKTYDCSRLNRERDARCPNWDPIEGRNAQGAAGFEVAVPKGLPKLRNPIGTNPLPVCPPGTPGNQMGLSCLPSREGPGIPRP